VRQDQAKTTPWSPRGSTLTCHRSSDEVTLVCANSRSNFTVALLAAADSARRQTAVPEQQIPKPKGPRGDFAAPLVAWNLEGRTLAGSAAATRWAVRRVCYTRGYLLGCSRHSIFNK
jgi:hypothetical protein